MNEEMGCRMCHSSEIFSPCRDCRCGRRVKVAGIYMMAGNKTESKEKKQKERCNQCVNQCAIKLQEAQI